MDSSETANVAEQCQALVESLPTGRLFRGENKGKNYLTLIEKPDVVYFIALTEVGPKGGFIGRFFVYDERPKILADRVRLYKGYHGSHLGPLKLPILDTKTVDSASAAAEKAMRDLKAEFDSGELTETSILLSCDLCFYEVRGDSIKGLVGGKCSPA